jgi:hypothetical protein
MAKLIPLREIPYVARATESAARREYSTRSAALEAASFEIVDAEGCYGGAYPHTHGWTLTRAAADAYASHVVYMPGGSCHEPYAVRT